MFSIFHFFLLSLVIIAISVLLQLQLPHHIRESTQFPMSATTDFISRPITTVVSNRLTPEGVGVSVLRSIGQNPRYYNPFALLDHFHLDANSLEQEIGFHPHPHRGISTLTYILPDEGNGSVHHKDHKGTDGIIGPGDIQYMSAGKGIVHSEMPGDQKAVHGLQLWVNLLKKDKMTEPEYQDYKSAELPVATQDNITAKVIAGVAFGVEAKVKTKTPVHYIHYKMGPNTTLHHPLPPHWSTFMYSFNGSGLVGPTGHQSEVKAKQTVFFAKGANAEEFITKETYALDVKIDQGEGVSVIAGDQGLDFVLIAGAPLPENEGVLQRGPVIVNSHSELMDFYDDLQNDKNGFEGYHEFVRKWKP